MLRNLHPNDCSGTTCPGRQLSLLSETGAMWALARITGAAWEDTPEPVNGCLERQLIREINSRKLGLWSLELLMIEERGSYSVHKSASFSRRPGSEIVHVL